MPRTLFGYSLRAIAVQSHLPAGACNANLRLAITPDLKGVRIMIIKSAVTGICAAMLMLGMSACEKKGPAEKAGEKVDQAAESVKESGEKAKEEVKEAADEVHDAVK